MNLPDAQAALLKAEVNTTVDSDSVFGVLVEENYVVCSENAVNTRMIWLEVSKHSC